MTTGLRMTTSLSGVGMNPLIPPAGKSFRCWLVRR